MPDQVLIFDMDGVLAEVTESYREGIVQTVEHFTGRRIARELIQEYKNRGGWNNDWALSQRIASDLGVEIPYDEVVTYFNKIFFGDGNDSLVLREQWLPAPGLLERLARRFQLSIFTGRIHEEANVTLRRFAAEIPFDPIVCADDIERSKPAPDGLLWIAERAPGKKLWYVGDTVDDARSAGAAGVPFIGIVARAQSHRDELVRLFQSENAVAIMDDVNQIEEVLR